MSVPVIISSYLMLNNAIIEKENSEVSKMVTTYKDGLDKMLIAFDRYKENVKENNNG